jgi:heme/copper-type cytochrome/quinol oxidase subunit 2
MDNFESDLRQRANRGVLVLGLTAFLVAAGMCLLQPHSIAAQEQPAQIVELKAKKYEYLGSPVHVKAGAKVQLKITALDHDHGFKVTTIPNGAGSSGKPGLVFDSPQDCWQIKKGETITIEFLAQTPGTYSFKCCHVCGMGHRGMKSEIIVD